MNDAALHNEMITALRWYADQGVCDLVLGTPEDYTRPQEMPSVTEMLQQAPAMGAKHSGTIAPADVADGASAYLGKSEALEEAIALAKSAKTLDALKQVIAEFEGIAIKKTASNMVFADGNPNAKVMIIGEAPGADEDRSGVPFSGVSGQLLDKIMACIGLSRDAQNDHESVYITNILNWRPPGNRSPNPAEIEVSLPFVERHIQLIKPDILILFGAVSAKALLGTDAAISRLRRSTHEYKILTKELGEAANIAAFPTYHPSFLLTTPLQKRSVWEDMLKIQKKMQK